jgi:hypothetical protein
MSSHDPIEQMRLLRQLLSSNRRPIGWFMGAGCPVAIPTEVGALLIPDVARLTEAVIAAAAIDPNMKDLLDKLTGPLNGPSARKPTVEDFFNASAHFAFSRR